MPRRDAVPDAVLMRLWYGALTPKSHILNVYIVMVQIQLLQEWCLNEHVNNGHQHSRKFMSKIEIVKT